MDAVKWLEIRRGLRILMRHGRHRHRGVEGRAKFRRVLFISCELTLERSASSGVLIEINHNTSPRAGRNARAHVPFGNLHKCQECPNLECPCRVCGVTVAARALNLRLNLRTSTRERRFPPFATGERGVWRAAETHRRHRSQQRPACACSFRPEGFTTITHYHDHVLYRRLACISRR